MIEFLNPYLPEWAQGLLVTITGTGVTLGVLIKFFATNIIKFLVKNYDFKNSKDLEIVKSELMQGLEILKSNLTQDLESEKAKLGNKTYISKVRFDAEFQIYRELSSAFFDAVQGINKIYPSGIYSRPADDEEYKELQEKNYKIAYDAVFTAQDIVHKNAAFISEELFQNYKEILSLCYQQVNAFAERWQHNHNDGYSYKIEHFVRTRDIEKIHAELVKNVRLYLSSLEVID